MGGSSQEMEGAWQIVSRRKGKETLEAQPPVTLPPSALNLYIPFNAKPLYSKALSSPPSQSSRPRLVPHNPKPAMASIQPTPSSPPPTNRPTYYFSPHSPTQLRFPPSSQYEEWRGRCFRCCRTGHNAAICRNPMKCGKCWGDGHVGHRCSVQTLNPATMPYFMNRRQTAQTVKKGHTTSFDDLLLKPCPLAAPSLPTARPKRLACFLNHDEAC